MDTESGPNHSGGSDRGSGGSDRDETLQLAQLEEDLSAVEVAIGHLDSIASDPARDSADVDEAAQRIALAVPVERFRTD